MRKSADNGKNGKGSARSTVSGPRKGPRNATGDPAVRKAQGTQALAAEFPFNREQARRNWGCRQEAQGRRYREAV